MATYLVVSLVNGEVPAEGSVASAHVFLHTAADEQTAVNDAAVSLDTSWNSYLYAVDAADFRRFLVTRSVEAA